MKQNKRTPKYANPTSVVKSGFRRVSKAELKALGYSTKSALYTRADSRNPTKFLTRADIRKVQKPIKDAELFSKFRFSSYGKPEKIKAARRTLFRHTHIVYIDMMRPVTLEQAIQLTRNYFEYLEKKYHPTWRNQIGMIYRGDDLKESFSLQPRLWRDREKLIIGSLKKMLNKYKAKMRIINIIGWIERSS